MGGGPGVCLPVPSHCPSYLETKYQDAPFDFEMISSAMDFGTSS